MVEAGVSAAGAPSRTGSGAVAIVVEGCDFPGAVVRSIVTVVVVGDGRSMTAAGAPTAPMATVINRARTRCPTVGTRILGHRKMDPVP
jgi:Flp pilus assembly secretin CpaC